MKNCKSNLFSIFLIIVAVVIVVSIGGSIFRAVKQSSVYEGFSSSSQYYDPTIPQPSINSNVTPNGFAPSGTYSSDWSGSPNRTCTSNQLDFAVVFQNTTTGYYSQTPAVLGTAYNSAYCNPNIYVALNASPPANTQLVLLNRITGANDWYIVDIPVSPANGGGGSIPGAFIFSGNTALIGNTPFAPVPIPAPPKPPPAPAPAPAPKQNINIKELDNVDCVYSQIPYPGATNPGTSSSNYTYLGNFNSYSDCVNNASIGPDAKAITWHKSNAGGYAGQCYSINNSNTQVPYTASTCGIIMPPAPAPAPAPAASITYYITGPSIGPSGNSKIPVSKTVTMGNQTVYIISDGGFTKMVQWPSNIAKYYTGDISSFSVANWSNYNVQNPGRYILTPTPPTPAPTPTPAPAFNNNSDVNTNRVCIPTNSDGSFKYKDKKYRYKPDPNYIYSNSNPPASGFFDQGTENYNQYLRSDYYWYGGDINKYSKYAPMTNSRVPNGTDCSSAYSCPPKTTNPKCLPGPGPTPPSCPSKCRKVKDPLMANSTPGVCSFNKKRDMCLGLYELYFNIYLFFVENVLMVSFWMQL